MSSIQNTTRKDTPNGSVGVSDEKLIQALQRMSYAFLKLPEKEQPGTTNFGYIYPGECPALVKHVMKKYVEWKDKLLDALQENSDAYAVEFGKRAFTFEEYKVVKSDQVAQEDYKHHRVFDYLYLIDRTEQITFISQQDDEKTDFENYLAVLQTYLRMEVPVLYEFFFKRKMPIYFPEVGVERHIICIGQSGSGKSECMKLSIRNYQRQSQLKRDRSIVLMEPNGDLAGELLRFSLNAGEGMKRIVFLDPFIRESAAGLLGKDVFSKDYTFVINPFENNGLSDQSINYLVQELRAAFYLILEEDPTPQMKALLSSCIDTLLRKGDASIADLKRFMNDDENDDLVQLGLQNPNPEHAAFFANYKGSSKSGLSSKLQTSKSSIYYKLHSIIADEGLRRLLVGKSTVNLEKELNEGKILILSLSKALLGEEAARDFGKLMMSFLMGIIRKRVSVAARYRKKTHVYLDEFHNYTNPKLKEIMRESRKYGFHCFLASQQVGQEMNVALKRVVMGNTAIKLASDNEPDSIREMCEQMGDLKPRDFTKLPPFSFYVYNIMNKDAGCLLLRVPDFLVEYKDKTNQYYLSNEHLIKLLRYQVLESGYYQPIQSNPSFSSISKVKPPAGPDAENPILKPKYTREDD